VIGTTVMKHMGWRSPRQTRLEQSDTAALDAAELQMLATFLRFPAAFFTTAPVSRVTVQDLLFRAPKSTTVAEKEYLAVLANVVGDLADELNGRTRLPAVLIEPLASGADVVAAAAQTRKWLGLDPLAPIKSLVYELECAGVPVVLRTRLSRSTGLIDWDGPADEPVGSSTEKHLGCSAQTGAYRERPVVLLRGQDSRERTRWTVAHEIGHLTLHRYGDITGREEREASRFASEFLAPAEALASEVSDVPTLNELVELKLKWRLSLGALIIHLRESKLIDATRAETLQRQLYTRVNTDTGHTFGKTEPGWNAFTPERPRLLSRWMEACYGTSAVDALAAHELIYPTDLLADILAGQRGAAAPLPARPPSARAEDKVPAGANVVALHRKRQQV
jgi:Zn-dependent peptidase ImmA (M78 family)